MNRSLVNECIALASWTRLVVLPRGTDSTYTPSFAEAVQPLKLQTTFVMYCYICLTDGKAVMSRTTWRFQIEMEQLHES